MTQETGLYYDPRTGTYFYYDHASQAYQFHSQVPVDEKAAKRGKRKDDAEREDSEVGIYIFFSSKIITILKLLKIGVPHIVNDFGIFILFVAIEDYC